MSGEVIALLRHGGTEKKGKNHSHGLTRINTDETNKKNYLCESVKIRG